MSQDAVRLAWTLAGAGAFVACLYLLATSFPALAPPLVLRAALLASPAIPIAWAATFYAFVLRAWVHLGYRPRMYQPGRG